MLVDITSFKNIHLNKSEKVWKILTDIHFCLPQFEIEKEYFYVLGMTRHMRLRYVDVVSVGSAVATICEAREVFRMAIHQGIAGGIICAHNHPSGNLSPSTSDSSITRKLKAAGEILDIPVLDHLIFTETGYFSFADEGLI